VCKPMVDRVTDGRSDRHSGGTIIATTTVDVAKSGDVVVGFDTHKYVHVGAVFDTTAGVLSTVSVPADSYGFAPLLSWAESFGQPVAFGIEGTGSYGGALTSFVRRRDYRVIEVFRPDRRIRRLVGESDTIWRPECGESSDGRVRYRRTENRRRCGRDDSPTRRRTRYCRQGSRHDNGDAQSDAGACTGILTCRDGGEGSDHAGPPLRGSDDRALGNPDDSIRITLASLARRWLTIDHEASELHEHIEHLVKTTAPQLVQSYGMGSDTAAEILIVFGDNPERIKSEAALAKLAGISPIPASSGTTTGKHRINHGGHRQLNAAIYRTVIVRMRFHEPTKIYIARRLAEGKAKRDIIRCLKRYGIREVYHLVNNPVTSVDAS